MGDFLFFNLKICNQRDEEREQGLLGSEGCPCVKGQGGFTHGAGTVLGGSFSEDQRSEM